MKEYHVTYEVGDRVFYGVFYVHDGLPKEAEKRMYDIELQFCKDKVARHIVETLEPKITEALG